VVPWLPGENPSDENIDLEAAAIDLAAFLLALQAIDTEGGPVKSGLDRGVPLASRDELTRAAISELGDRVDTARVTSVWKEALAAYAWPGQPLWIHGDLLPGNVLVHARRLSAVIDFGALGLGDPAADVVPAWTLFDRQSRRVFREALGCDEDAWQRGRGWALSTALVSLPYYWDTAPHIVAENERRIAAVLED
jgi:aminoglycoside phosphotransferase (APT) family kinase protein